MIQYATLREYLNPNVKKVLFFYFEANDFRCLLEEKDNKILINYLNDLNKSDGPLFKIENDPRIIKSLGLVREYSLDEILQFSTS